MMFYFFFFCGCEGGGLKRVDVLLFGNVQVYIVDGGQILIKNGG